MSQFGLPTQPADRGEAECLLAPSYQGDLSTPQPASTPDTGDRSSLPGSITALLALLLVVIGAAFLVNKNKISYYEHRADAAERELNSALKAETEQKKSFRTSGLRDLYSRFEMALTEVTRTGNEIDNAPSQDGISLYPAYRTAMSECRTAAAAYNNAARRYPPKYFTGSDFPPMIDIGDTPTNCIDDTGEN
jgi:hypothetical protein